MTEHCCLAVYYIIPKIVQNGCILLGCIVIGCSIYVIHCEWKLIVAISQMFWWLLSNQCNTMVWTNTNGAANLWHHASLHTICNFDFQQSHYSSVNQVNCQSKSRWFERYSVRPPTWGQRPKLTSEVTWPLCQNDIKSSLGAIPSTYRPILGQRFRKKSFN